ncbi:MAG: hypothetical protein LBT03_02225 [Holosporales bacterium]|nr:hypothetical protein [Holosporales bacterium]
MINPFIIGHEAICSEVDSQVPLSSGVVIGKMGGRQTIKRPWMQGKNGRASKEAVDECNNKRIPVLDFGSVSDFQTNGDAAVAAILAKLNETNSYGTNSPNIYINLSNTGINSSTLLNLATKLGDNERDILLNVSYNGGIGDDAIDAIISSLLPNMFALNIAGTTVTDVGIRKLAACIEQNGLGKLRSINIKGTRITKPAAMALQMAYRNALGRWQAENPGQTLYIGGGIESDFIDQIETQPSAVIPEMTIEQKPLESVGSIVEFNTNEAAVSMPLTTGAPDTEEINSILAQAEAAIQQ